MNSSIRSKVYAVLSSFGFACVVGAFSLGFTSTAHAAVQEVSVQELLHMVPGSGPIVVEFYDSTDNDASGECSKQKPIFEKVAADYAGKATFVRLDISKARTFAESDRFTVCPSHLFLDHNKAEPNRISKRHWGLLTEQQFQELLKDYFNV
ncbi:hypothetical protein BH11CYA1_BH11CYA1_06620 [soil metagenome]